MQTKETLLARHLINPIHSSITKSQQAVDISKSLVDQEVMMCPTQAFKCFSETESLAYSTFLRLALVRFQHLQ